MKLDNYLNTVFNIITYLFIIFILQGRVLSLTKGGDNGGLRF
jgi:hypothetical protein